MAEIPAAIPPTSPVTTINTLGLPPNGNKTAMRFAKVKSFPLLKINEYADQNIKMAKKGTKNTAKRFKGKKSDVASAAVITDHHGKNNESTYAKIIVTIKLMIFLLIGCRY